MHIAIVGATGAVGREFSTILEQRRFPAERVSFLASERSAGQTIIHAKEEHTVRVLSDEALSGVDVALFSAGSRISRAFASRAVEHGAVVIDNSSAFRMDDGVPLVIPEVNSEDMTRHTGIIANPNCSTIILAVALWPLHRINPIRRAVVSTYQAASGAGAAAMAELERQARDVLDGKAPKPEAFAHPCAFNLFSHDSPIDEGGYNEEERKMENETRKIFHAPGLRISATCVRVPVLRAHCESVSVTFARPFAEDEARAVLADAPGVCVVDDRAANHFPMPVEAAGGDDVLVGRIRTDCSDPTGCSLALFLSGDQLRKGAALNAVQIAEHL